MDYDWTQHFQKAAIFSNLTDEEAGRIVSVAETRTYRPGEVLFAEGDPRSRTLMIVSGRVDLTRIDPWGAPRRVITHARGDFMGEGMFIENSMHSTTATAVTETVVAFVHRDKVLPLIQNDLAFRNRILNGLLDDIVGRLDQTLFRTSGAVRGFRSGRTREEHDLLGTSEVPAEAYFGVQTSRALDNFDIGGARLSAYPNLVRGLAMVKKAAALANRDCGVLAPEIAEAIVEASDDIIGGKLHDQFVVDELQGGAGTSTNMNANEVIANRALEILGFDKGDYEHVHPNNHVNASQSTNDVYPTALKLGMILSSQRLIDGVELLVEALRAKGAEFSNVVKMGRTQLQDAVPMTLGQEFDAYAASLSQELRGLGATSRMLQTVNMGGTAIGTGLNAPKAYRAAVLQHLREVTGLDLQLAPDLIEATQDTQAFVMFSSALKSLAIKLSKICNDLRLLSSGPRAGLAEIQLPPRQPGSSIMPGKVNPVIPEVVNQVAYRVIGNDLTVTLAAEAGQLELNVMEPVIAASIFESLKILANAVITLRHNCIEGIRANVERCRSYVENSIGLVTALVPRLGYEVASRVAKRALAEDLSVAQVVRDEGLLSDAEIEELIAPERMAHPE